jgi:hypothetical protein
MPSTRPWTSDVSGPAISERLSILPGVRVNLSKSGASTSIGPRGADVNIGRDGVTTNAGIPGTGLSYRQKIGGGQHSHGMLGVAALVGGLAVWGVQHFEKITHVFTPAQQTVHTTSTAPENAAQQPASATQTAATPAPTTDRSPVNTSAPGLRFVHRGGSVIRDTAKTSGQKLKKEIKGAQVTLIAQDGDGWAKVRDGNITGWMRASVLGTEPPK